MWPGIQICLLRLLDNKLNFVTTIFLSRVNQSNLWLYFSKRLLAVDSYITEAYFFVTMLLQWKFLILILSFVTYGHRVVPGIFSWRRAPCLKKEKNLRNAIIVEIISSEHNVPKLPWGRFLSRSKIELWKDPAFGNCWPIIDSESERLLSFCSKDLKTREVVKNWGSVPAFHPAALGSILSIPARHSLNIFSMLPSSIDWDA